MLRIAGETYPAEFRLSEAKCRVTVLQVDLTLWRRAKPEDRQRIAEAGGYVVAGKRGFRGKLGAVSRELIVGKYLQSYMDECSFRCNHIARTYAYVLVFPFAERFSSGPLVGLARITLIYSLKNPSFVRGL